VAIDEEHQTDDETREKAMNDDLPTVETLAAWLYEPAQLARLFPNDPAPSIVPSAEGTITYSPDLVPHAVTTQEPLFSGSMPDDQEIDVLDELASVWDDVLQDLRSLLADFERDAEKELQAAESSTTHFEASGSEEPVP